VALEDIETTGGYYRSYLDVCRAVIDRKSAVGYVAIYDNCGSYIQKVWGGEKEEHELDNQYAELVVEGGQTCVVYGRISVLYYKPGSLPALIRDLRNDKARDPQPTNAKGTI
jgi:hypothetical protein